MINHKERPLTAYIYVRTAHHAAPGDPGNILDQLNALRCRAAEHGYVIVGEFTDDGASGNSMDRRGLNGLMAAIDKKVR